MPRVFIPPLLRSLTDGREVVEVAGQSVLELIENLDQQFPGVRARLIHGERLTPGLNVVVGTMVSSRGLLHKIKPDDEVHFLPAIGGG